MNLIQQKFNYRALTEEVNRRMGKNYGMGYVRAIHKGDPLSAPVAECIKKILAEQPDLSQHGPHCQGSENLPQTGRENGKAV